MLHVGENGSHRQQQLVAQGFSGLGTDTFCYANNIKLTSNCGGAGGPDLSCSPFNYRPFQFNFQNQTPNPCSGDPYTEIVAGAALNPRQGARAWTSYPNRSDYWVFHNCDGAGIQPDCLGDIKYIERFEGYNKPGTEVVCDGKDGSRNHCSMVHPSTRTVFDKFKYWGGWYGFGKIGTNDCQAGKSRSWNLDVCNKILSINGGKHPYEGTGATALFSFMLYPWVCNSDQAMQNSNFSSPTLEESGTKQGWKCYVDNEPLTDGNDNPGWPPLIEIYFFALYKTTDGKDQLKFDKYMVSNKNYPELIGKAYEIYPCNPGDGSNCPW
ncbi:hypothetical protein KBY67_14460 [Synechococcus sp. RedBA-s]|nr:hypothetical protein [Synechococcus sp. RedBA-s]